MEFELWWLIALPLFFTLGWIAARVDIQQILSATTVLPAAYFKGLNFLISDQHDKAIEAFTEAVEANAESMELHFALGSLFRRTGELDRAIHLHLSLLERQELPAAQRQSIMAELAQDYLKAGLLDRAEELFGALDDSRYRQAAIRALLEIYTREREWQRAIKAATELERISGIPFRKEIAQFYCEMAMRSMLDHDAHTARHELDAALDANKQCVRASIMLGDMEAEAGNHKIAISLWKRVEFQDAESLALVAPKLIHSHRALGKLGEGQALILQYYETYQLPSLLNLGYELTLEQTGPAQALHLARQALERRPSLQTLEHLLKAKVMLTQAQPDGDPQESLIMQHTIKNAIGNRHAYHCKHCGFKARMFHWQCPACNAWESIAAEPREFAL